MDLTKQRQAFNHDPENGVHGDCWRTAVACVLRVDRDLIPHEHRDMDHEEWRSWTRQTLYDLGLRSINIPFSHSGERSLMDDVHWAWSVVGSPCIMQGMSPRGVNHCIAIIGPHAVWDPSASDGFIIGPCEPDGFYWLEILVPFRTASIVARQNLKRKKS